MTSTIITDPVKDEGFPKLMIGKSCGNIVLFYAPNTGVCIVPAVGSGIAVGEWGDKWYDTYEPFHGTIQLRNE